MGLVRQRSAACCSSFVITIDCSCRKISLRKGLRVHGANAVGDLDQLQFLSGHVSIRLRSAIWDAKQNLHCALIDRMRIEPKRTADGNDGRDDLTSANPA